MTDLIKRDDALALCDRYPYVEGVKSTLEDLPAIDPAPAKQVTLSEAEAIREAALREAAELVQSTAYTSNGDKRSLEPVSVGFEGMDMHHATIADAILALIKGETK